MTRAYRSEYLLARDTHSTSVIYWTGPARGYLQFCHPPMVMFNVGGLVVDGRLARADGAMTAKGQHQITVLSLAELSH